MKITTKSILLFLGVLVIGYLFWYFSTILVYILIAGIISLMGKPLMTLLEKVKYKNFQLPVSVRSLITLTAFWVVIIYFFKIMVPIVVYQANQFAAIDVTQIEKSIQPSVDEFGKAIHQENVLEEQKISKYISEKVSGFLNVSNLSSFFSFVSGMLGNIFIAAFSITFIVFFFLMDDGMFYRIILFFVPDKYDDRFLKALKEIQSLLSRYFVGLGIESFLVAGLRVLAFHFILGMSFSNSLVIGIFSGIINVVPFVGPIIGTIFSILFTIVISFNAPLPYSLGYELLFVVIIYLAVQLIDNFLFQPYIYSKSVKAHPLEVFLVILMADSVAGIPGMILGIPVYTALRVMANEFFSKFRVVREITHNLNK